MTAQHEASGAISSVGTRPSGLIGAVMGVVGGLLLALVLIHVINKQSFGWTIQMTVPGGVILQAVGLALTAALVAGYWPARWAARQPVVEGLREE